MRTVTLKVDGMHCEGCAGRIRTLLEKEPGVRRAEVSFTDGEARVRHNPHAVELERLAEVIEKGGLRVAAQSS